MPRFDYSVCAMNTTAATNSNLDAQNPSHRLAVVSHEELPDDSHLDEPFNYDEPYDDTPMYTDDAHYDPSSDF